MSGLMQEMAAKAQRLNIPLNVQLDLTYRCNERCVHCYLDHHDHGEMTTSEIKSLLPSAGCSTSLNASIARSFGFAMLLVADERARETLPGVEIDLEGNETNNSW